MTIPELAQLFGASSVGVSTTVGTYYYTYVATSLVAGVIVGPLVKGLVTVPTFWYLAGVLVVSVLLL